MNNKVGIERCNGYNPEELYRALKAAAQAAGIPEAAGKTVLLKPNILMDTSPDRAVTTHPCFLEAAIRLVREWGASRILVGDSPGIQGPNYYPRASGLRETAQKNNAEWVDFTKTKMELESKGAKVQRRFTVTGYLDECDLVINLPKLKTHQLMYFTGAMKNSFGIIPSLAKTPFHVRYPTREAFASMIVDLNLAVKNVYALMDAVVAMEGPGPGSGSPRNLGLVLASSNFLAMDAAACSIVGYPPEKIPTNRDALVRQYWLKNFSEIEYPLLNPEEVKVQDFIKIPFKKSGNQFLDFIVPWPFRKFKEKSAALPAIDHSICLRCGDCIKICASGAISFEGEGNARQAVVDKRRCIRCYCCHEICPHKAIEVKNN